MDADDLVVFSPCAVGLDELLKICELYAIEHDITRSVLQLCLQTEILSMYTLVISTYLDAKYHICRNLQISWSHYISCSA